MTSKTEAMEACPFCGGADISVDHAGVDSHYFVQCNDCDVVQDYDHGHTRAEAITAWNRRPTPSVPAEGLVEELGGRIAVDGLVAIPEALYHQVLATLSATPVQADDVSGLVEVVLLLSELIDGPSKGAFYGIGATLRAKLDTIRTIAEDAALRSTPAPDALVKAGKHLLDMIEVQERNVTPAPKKRETLDDENSRDERDQVFADAVERFRTALSNDGGSDG